MPTDKEMEALLGPEIYKKAKAMVEAAGPDFDWGPLKKAVDEMMKGAAAIQGMDFETLEKFFDEAVQTLKTEPA